jgi:CheY-like chemotaxis protein
MAKSSQTRRIFLAEDNAADVVLVREALKRHSITCELTAYPNAQAAILAAEQCGLDGHPIPSLILVDLNLPWGHGCDVLEAAAKNPALDSVRKAILSSFVGSSSDVERARRLGATHFIMKPANLQAFLDDVRKANRPFAGILGRRIAVMAKQTRIERQLPRRVHIIQHLQDLQRASRCNSLLLVTSNLDDCAPQKPEMIDSGSP